MALQHDQVASLCAQFEASDADSNRSAISGVKAVLEAVKKVVPSPVDSLAGVALMVVQAAENAVVNKIACVDLARRIARINFIVLQLMLTKGTDAVRKCTEDLTVVFNRAVTLLEKLRDTKGRRWVDLSWIERVKATCKKYSPRTAEEIAAIHIRLDHVVSETNLAVTLQLQQCAGPSLDDIRVAMRDEMTHIVDQIQCLELKGEDMNAVHQQLQVILHSEPFSGLPEPQQYLDARDVIIDKNMVLGGSKCKVYAGTLYGLTEVAVKVVKMVEDDVVPMIEDEVRRANRSRHRNVVRFFGIVVVDDETVWVVMERLGESLAKAQVTEASARMKYTRDIIAGMEHMHSRDHRVVHFDLKPANILLTQDRRRAKIIGFGFALTASTLAIKPNKSSTRGTIPFMAPELFSASSRPSSACDVYSFAVVLAELWSGAAAWEETDSAAIIKDVAAGSRPFSPSDLSTKGVPASIIALIVACWAQEPYLRPTFAQLAGLPDSFDEVPQEKWPYFVPAAGTGSHTI
jgi:serine/threonine protein kinase